MMIATLFLFSLTLPIAAHAEGKINWDHCIAELSGDTNRKDLIGFENPIAFLSDLRGHKVPKGDWSIEVLTGKVKWAKALDPNRNQETTPDGGTTYQFDRDMVATQDLGDGDTAKGSSPHKVKVTVNKDGTLRSVDEFAVDLKTNIHREFDARNSVCFPKEETTVGPDRKGTGVRNGTNWNTDACRELWKLTTTNKEALNCSCGTPATQKQMEDILGKYKIPYKADDKAGLNYRDIVGGLKDKTKDSEHVYGAKYDDIHPLLKGLGTKPFVAAVSLLEHCEENHAVSDAVEDELLSNPKALPKGLEAGDDDDDDTTPKTGTTTVR